MSINEGYMRVVDINAKADLEKQQEARNKLASNTHLQHFMKALRVAFRGITFTPHPHDVRRVWVHMPKDPFCLGWIGYGDFQTITTRSGAYTMLLYTSWGCPESLRPLPYSTVDPRYDLGRSRFFFEISPGGAGGIPRR